MVTIKNWLLDFSDGYEILVIVVLNITVYNLS